MKVTDFWKALSCFLRFFLEPNFTNPSRFVRSFVYEHL